MRTQQPTCGQLLPIRKPISEPLSVVGLFVLLSCALVAYIDHGQISSHMQLGSDSAFVLWCLKWWPHSLFSFNESLHAPFFAPWGQNLAWTTSVPALALLAAPITLMLGPVTAYNVITIVALASNGVVAYFIARELECNKSAAIFAALLFYFSSYTWAQLIGHMNLYVTMFTLFALLLTTLRFRMKVGRITYVCIMSALLSIQFLVSAEIFATLIFFGAIAVLAGILTSGNPKSFGRRLVSFAVEIAIVIIISASILSPYIYSMLSNPVSNIQPQGVYVADPINYVIPTSLNWLFGTEFQYISNKFTGNLSEQGAYIGLPVFVLMFLGGLRFYMKSHLNGFLGIVFIVIVIFSFGAVLTIVGVHSVWMPWSIVRKLPLIREALPARFTLYTSLVSALIVARVLTEQRSVTKYTVAGIAILAILPNLNIYHASTGLVPSSQFFQTGAYKQYLKPGANVLILPTYLYNGYQPALWQEQSNFGFDLVNGLAGMGDSGVSMQRYGWIYYGNSVPINGKFWLLNFLKTTNTQFVLIDANAAPDPLMSLFMSMNLPYQQVGAIRITRIHTEIIDRELNSELIGASAMLCQSLVKLAQYGQSYHTSHGRFDGLIPAAIADSAFITTFGSPRPAVGPAANWTSDGYWLGAWPMRSMAVGYSSIGTAEATELYRDFSGAASTIYFPYPRVFHGKAAGPASGQILIVLKQTHILEAHCEH